MIGLAFIAAAMVGTLARWGLGAKLAPPSGTLVANLAGAFALGWLSGSSSGTETVIGIAALGSLTTFSTLVIELLELARSRPRQALAYATLTFVGGIALAWLGLRLA